MPIIDTVPAFLDFWDNTRELARPLQLLTWEKEYYEPNRQVFDLYFTRWGDRWRLTEALGRYPKSVGTIRTLAATLPQDAEMTIVQVSSVLTTVAAIDVIAFVGAYGAGSWSWPVFSRPAALIAVESFTGRDRLCLAMAHEISHAVAQNAAGIGFGETHRYQNDLLFNLAFEGLAILVSGTVRPGLADGDYAWPDGPVATAADRLNWCRRHQGDLLRAFISDSLSNDPEVRDRYFGPSGAFMGQTGTGQWLALEFAREALNQANPASDLAGGIEALRGAAADWLQRAGERGL